MPMQITPEGVLHGIPDPVPTGEQRVDEYFIQVADAGPNHVVGPLDPNDAVLARTLYVRGEAPWMVDQLIPLLPSSTPSHSRVDDRTCAVGGTAEYLALSLSEAWQRVENAIASLTEMMHAYCPNSRYEFEVGQIHHIHASQRQSALKRFTMTVSETDGIAHVGESINGTSNRAAVLLELAQTNGRVSEALALLQGPEPSWAAVYNALKFVERSAVATGKKSKIGIHRRTANWHRHLGEPNREPMPTNPPTLVQARTFAFGPLREWLELRVAQYLQEKQAVS